MANSDYSGTDSLTGNEGDTVAVTCDTGYSGSGTATCTSGSFNTVTCSADACSQFAVENSDRTISNPIDGYTGDTVQVVCDTGFVGGGTTTCQTNGVFSDVACDGI